MIWPAARLEITLLDRVVLEQASHLDRLRIVSRMSFILVTALYWFAAGVHRPLKCRRSFLIA